MQYIHSHRRYNVVWTLCICTQFSEPSTILRDIITNSECAIVFAGAHPIHPHNALNGRAPSTHPYNMLIGRGPSTPQNKRGVSLASICIHQNSCGDHLASTWGARICQGVSPGVSGGCKAAWHGISVMGHQVRGLPQILADGVALLGSRVPSHPAHDKLVFCLL